MSQLVSSAEATEATHQHIIPCSDCAFARTALPGWLGGSKVDEWVACAHSDYLVECHTKTGAQCAGVAIYRNNVAKFVEAPLLRLPKDKEKVFATPMEFRAHHEKFSKKGKKKK